MKIWLKIAKLPKSSYYEWVEKLNIINQKEAELVETIKEIITESKGRFGYRRVNMELRARGIIVNHKKVLRLMRENCVLCIKFGRKNRKYSSFKGEIGKVADNVINQEFYVEKANEIWLSDITEFSIPKDERKLYLSPILDLYNSEILSYSIGFSPTVALTNKSLKLALNKLPESHNLIIHTDQGFHYQHKSWTNMLDARKVRQSMSRRGNCLDNSPMENFFGILKQEMFYGENFENLEHLKREIENYINWYNNKRRKEKLNGLSPIEYRLQAA